MLRSLLRAGRLGARRVVQRQLSSEADAPKSRSKRRLRRALLYGVGGGVVYHMFLGDIRATWAYAAVVDNLAMPALRSVDAETAHNYGIMSAAFGFAPVHDQVESAYRAKFLRTRVCGLEFRNPIGLAAGFDKQAQAMEGLLASGFGFVEVGTVTPLPQPGNPQPRMFRLPNDRAVINRFGFNSDGIEAVQDRLGAYWLRLQLARPGAVPGDTLAGQGSGEYAVPRGVLGVNIGKNKEGDAVADYTAGTVALAPFADYLAVNISSPNTPGLRALQGKEQLLTLLRAVMAARNGLPWGEPVDDVLQIRRSYNQPVEYMYWKLMSERSTPPPVWVKIAPDLTSADIEDIAAVVLEVGVDGVIVTNTTVARPKSLYHKEVAGEAGGLSGQPLYESSTSVLAALHGRLGGKVPLIGVGGVGSCEQAVGKLQAGASLVQVYTALAYEGPTLVPRITDGIVRHLLRTGLSNVRELVDTKG